MLILTSDIDENTIVKQALTWILRKFNLKKNQISAVQNILKLQNIINCIVNLKKHH